MKKIIGLWVACALIACGLPALAQDELLAYPLARYEEKTAAGIAGHVAGLLSGYEFIWQGDQPLVPLPEEWFALLGGPYGNGSARGGAGVTRMLPGGIGSDDDLHIDFFNQTIIAQSGGLPSHKQIYDAWRAYKVSDWGGGDKAMAIMRKQKLPPPYTGLMEYGNIFHWCTEPYIETETLGMNAPGMPQTAWRWADRFASVTGDFESLDWARFWASAYAKAYVAEDVRPVLDSAALALLSGSWPRQIYERCLALYEGGASWREAVVEIHNLRRGIHQADNIQCAADVNNGFAVLALLYGEGDWLASVKLASICGYDADCTAATVGGLVGILRGMDGLPPQVLAEVWQDGRGVYVNDRQFPPHIGGDYPDTQTFGELAMLYVANGLAQIQAAGGRVTGDMLYLPVELDATWQGWQPDNADFEAGVLTGWSAAGEAEFRCLSDGTAHSGDGCAAIRLQENAASASLTTQLAPLETGAWYRVSVYVATSFDGEARLQVSHEGTVVSAAVLNANKGWVRREVIFQAAGDSAQVALVAAQQPGDGGITAYFDDLRVEKLQPLAFADVAVVRIDEQAPYTMMVEAPTDGDWALCMPYSHAGTGLVSAAVTVDGEAWFNIAFAPTSRVPGAGQHEVQIPLRLVAGAHTVAVAPAQDGVMLYGTALMAWPQAALE